MSKAFQGLTGRSGSVVKRTVFLFYSVTKGEEAAVIRHHEKVGMSEQVRTQKGSELRDSSGLKGTQGPPRFALKRVATFGEVRTEKGH